MYDEHNKSGSPVGSFDRATGTYHYSYTPQYNPLPTPPDKKPRKKLLGLKIAALVVCCAIVGGVAGVGGAAVYDLLHGDGGSSAQQVQQDPPEQGNESQGGQTVINRNETDPTPVQVQQADGLKEMNLAEIYASYADSCVCITITATVQSGWYEYEASGAGSGFIISEDGFILTNYHVIDGAKSITVTLNSGESHEATLVGGEELNDIAVLKINDVSGLKPVVLGDSDDLVVGETVCTIGNALGTLSFSQTSGAVSATNRSVTMSDGTVLNMIQTDCTINSGNSGGPLFDSYGRVAGIVSAKYSNNGDSSSASIEGIGFAIPINDVIDMVTDYMEYGYVTGRPYMGVSVVDITEQYMTTFGWPQGAYINSVEAGSCAEEAGLLPGDIITKIDDTDITGVSQMVSVKNSYRAGDRVTITVYRSGEYLELTMTFDEQAAAAQSSGGSQGGSPGRPGGR